MLNEFIGEMLEAKITFNKGTVASLSFSCQVDSSDEPEFVKTFLEQKAALEAYTKAQDEAAPDEVKNQTESKPFLFSTDPKKANVFQMQRDLLKLQEQAKQQAQQIAELSRKTEKLQQKVKEKEQLKIDQERVLNSEQYAEIELYEQ